MTRTTATLAAALVVVIAPAARAENCPIGAAAGAPYYNAMRAAGSPLTPVELIYHAANRLGFGHSSLGPLRPADASDCSRVVLAEAIASQLASVGAKADTVQIAETRSRLMPLSRFTRKEINATLNRFAGANEMAAFGALQWRAWQHIALLTTLREMTGSQSMDASGAVSDIQINLDAVLSEFWFNHFNVSASKSTQYIFGTDGYHPTIRANIGGTFYALLRAVMRHPAMLIYLDNAANRYDSSTGTASNQNLARELLELHTFGLPPKKSSTDTSSIYGQSDIVELAKILAGWNAYAYTDAPAFDGFVYHDALAANVTVRFLGVDYPSTGASRVESVLRWLANHPQTKSHICSKLAGVFYAPTLIGPARDACIAAWGSDGDLKAMVAALLQRTAFWNRTNYRTLYHTPIELIVMPMRQIGMTAAALQFSVVAEGRTGSEFPIATLSAQDFMSRLDALHNARTWQPMWAMMLRIEDLLGAFRMNVAPPTGYNMDGAAYFSTAYLDRVSRMPLELAGKFDYLHDAARNNDQTSPLVRWYLAASINDIGAGPAFERYVATGLGMGGIVSSDAASRTPAPYIMAPEHAYIMLVTAGDPSHWAYWFDAPDNKYVEKTWPALALATSDELRK
jgi:Protein of unknown function (DUF1800)